MVSPVENFHVWRLEKYHTNIIFLIIILILTIFIYINIISIINYIKYLETGLASSLKAEKILEKYFTISSGNIREPVKNVLAEFVR